MLNITPGNIACYWDALASTGRDAQSNPTGPLLPGRLAGLHDFNPATAASTGRMSESNSNKMTMVSARSSFMRKNTDNTGATFASVCSKINPQTLSLCR